MSARQAEIPLRRLQPLPAWQGENDCADCNSCPHGKLKYSCADCNPCPHGKLKKHCAACKATRTGQPAQPQKVKPDPEVKQEPFTIRGYFGFDQ